MTKPRYYYTDPLAAAWMAKHFGMKLTARHTDEQMADYDIPESQRDFDWFDSCIVDGWERDVEMVSDAVGYIEAASAKIYIHPDSLHLLDLHFGDLCLDDDPTDGAYRWYDVHTSAALRKFNKIIQRNGIAFMWPEVEA